MDDSIFVSYLEDIGLSPVGKLGEGAEGVVFDLGDRVAKFWFDDDDNSYKLWVKAYKTKMAGFPKIYSVKRVQLPRPWVDATGFVHDQFKMMIIDKVKPIYIDTNFEPYTEIVKPYQSLNMAFMFLNSGDYTEAVKATEFKDFVRVLINIHKMVIARGYDELSPQVGIDSDGQLVMMDLI